jgi:hypothetical protein
MPEAKEHVKKALAFLGGLRNASNAEADKPHHWCPLLPTGIFTCYDVDVAQGSVGVRSVQNQSVTSSGELDTSTLWLLCGGPSSSEFDSQPSFDEAALLSVHHYLGKV